MTSWIVGHTDRFRPPAPSAPSTTMPSMFGTSDIGLWFNEAAPAGVPPWEDMRWYLERSPLTYAQRHHAPRC